MQHPFFPRRVNLPLIRCSNWIEKETREAPVESKPICGWSHFHEWLGLHLPLGHGLLNMRLKGGDDSPGRYPDSCLWCDSRHPRMLSGHRKSPQLPVLYDFSISPSLEERSPRQEEKRRRGAWADATKGGHWIPLGELTAFIGQPDWKCPSGERDQVVISDLWHQQGSHVERNGWWTTSEGLSEVVRTRKRVPKKASGSRMVHWGSGEHKTCW